jgi:hypothetical protein
MPVQKDEHAILYYHWHSYIQCMIELNSPTLCFEMRYTFAVIHYSITERTLAVKSDDMMLN